MPIKLNKEFQVNHKHHYNLPDTVVVQSAKFGRTVVDVWQEVEPSPIWRGDPLVDFSRCGRSDSTANSGKARFDRYFPSIDWRHKCTPKEVEVAKLQPEISPGKAFGDILMEPRRAEAGCEFVEVHVFDAIHRLGIERIVGPVPTDRADRATWNQIVRKAKELGVKVEVSP